MCLANGAQEFWVVDPKNRRVRVSTANGTTNMYEAGQAIPLSLFGNASLSVDTVFRGID
jgi:Uma2 family endonuclease